MGLERRLGFQNSIEGHSAFAIFSSKAGLVSFSNYEWQLGALWRFIAAESLPLGVGVDYARLSILDGLITSTLSQLSLKVQMQF